MKITIILIILFAGIIKISFSQTNLCNQASPFCTGTIYNFPAPVNTGTAETGPDYGCLTVHNNPSWFYLLINQPGDISIDMHTVPQHDVDFICWGPFTSQTAPCTNELTAGNIIDCSFNTSYQEWCFIPNTITGQYYILLMTNYSNGSTNNVLSQINVGQVGAGSTLCTTSVPLIKNEEKLSINPNPVSNENITINYTSDSFENISINIFNVNGIKEFSKDISKNKKSIEIHLSSMNLYNGYYIVELIDGIKTYRRPIIIQNK